MGAGGDFHTEVYSLKDQVGRLRPGELSQPKVVIWCFKPSQPQRIISGLKETFAKRYIVERTNKAEGRLEEQSEKVESCRQNLWNEIQLKGP